MNLHTHGHDNCAPLKLPLKLNPRPKMARLAMRTVQIDLTKATQNHSKRRETGHYNTQVTNFDLKVGSLHKKMVWKLPLAKIPQFDLGMLCPIKVEWLQECSNTTSKHKQQRQRTAVEQS